MDITAKDRASKKKLPNFVGRKRHIYCLAGLNTLGNVDTIVLQAESVGDIGAAQFEANLIAFGHLDHRFYRRPGISPQRYDVIGPNFTQYPPPAGSSSEGKFFGCGIRLGRIQVAIIGPDAEWQADYN